MLASKHVLGKTLSSKNLTTIQNKATKSLATERRHLVVGE